MITAFLGRRNKGVFIALRMLLLLFKPLPYMHAIESELLIQIICLLILLSIYNLENTSALLRLHRNTT